MSAWPKPHNPEHLFTKALLIHGPLPSKGWNVSRGSDGTPVRIYPYTAGKARKFQNAVADMFADEVWRRYAVRNWTKDHCNRVGMMWKNLFLLWIWEKIDEA